MATTDNILKEALALKGLENQVTLKLKQVESISRSENSGKYKYVISLGRPTDNGDFSS